MENLVLFYCSAVCSIVRTHTQFGWVVVSASKSAQRKSSDGHIGTVTPKQWRSLSQWDTKKLAIWRRSILCSSG